MSGIDYIPPARKHCRLWVVSTIFNPAGYKSLSNNYRRFAAQMDAYGVNLVTVELTYPGQYPTISGPGVMHMQATDVMWHKERLLNLAIRQLPAGCDRVAWVDADILFNNEHWVRDTIAALDKHPVVQMFERAILLDSQGNYYHDAYGFAFSRRSGFLDDPGDRYTYFNGNTKHPGFAWAARRETIEAWGGLYDHHILGGGDFQIALATIGDQSQAWYGRFGPLFQQHMLQWSTNCHQVTKGNLGYVPGSILHMWHGRSEDRQYVERSRCLVDGQFDPLLDIAEDENGLWRWSSDKPQMHKKVSEYFSGRNEDHDFPVHPTRYEDKYPVILNGEGGPQAIEAVLERLSMQGRTDFCVFVACADWSQVGRIKHVLRDRPWPFELRIRGSYQLPQREVPRRFQVVRSLVPENRAKRCVFLDKDTQIGNDFITRVTHAGRLVVDCTGRLLGADTSLVRAKEVQRVNPHLGEVRLITYAASRGVTPVTL